MFFVDVITGFILPMIYDSLVVLVAVSLILFIFRIKDSNMRILFFFLPLIKPFIIILEKVDLHGDSFYEYLSPRGFSGLRFPDPNNIVGYELSPIGVISDFNSRILLITMLTVLTLMVIRWVAIGTFYRRLAYEEKVGRRELPEVFTIIDDFVKRAKVRKPEVNLTHRGYLSPFVVGVRRFTMVLSPQLLDELDFKEKEVLIKHELSHVKRNDGFIGWIALILRDFNFFNPVAYIAYYLIRSEQERACDKLVLKYSDTPAAETARHILGSIVKMKKIIQSPRRLIPAGGSTFSPMGFINYRRLNNRVMAILKTDPSKISMRVLPKIFMYLTFIFLLFAQVVFVFNLGDLVIFLR